MSKSDPADGTDEVCGASASETSVEGGAADPPPIEEWIAVIDRLIPYVLLVPRGIERSLLEQGIARHIGASLGALRAAIEARLRSSR